VEKDKNMTKADKARSFSSRQIKRIHKGLNKEFGKKGVPKSALTREGLIVNPSSLSLDDNVPEFYSIKWDIGFVKHNSWVAAEAAVSVFNIDENDANMLLSKVQEQANIYPNPHFNANRQEGPGNERQLRFSVPGSAEWRRLNLTSSGNSHNAAHELFHNFIHNHVNNSSSTSPAYRRQINSFQGHLNAGGIFIREDARHGTKLKNINQKNIVEMLIVLPTINVNK
jgi:hypothetical protein